MSDDCMFLEKLLFVDSGRLSLVLAFAVLLLELGGLIFNPGLLECFLPKFRVALVNDATSLFFAGDLASLYTELSSRLAFLIVIGDASFNQAFYH